MGTMSILCSQCGGPAERCERCAGPICARRLCAELHDAACAAVSALPAAPATPTGIPYTRRQAPRRRERNPEAERLLAEQLGLTIAHHRRAGRAALLAGDLDTAFDELWAARQFEPDLDRLGAGGRAVLPPDWEMETDLTPLARALSAHAHPRAGDAWRRVLEDRPARSIQAEAAEWLAREAFGSGQPRAALRILHAARMLGRAIEPLEFQRRYRHAGLDPAAAFSLYLAASRLDSRTARAVALHDPLTDAAWSDQDARWWTVVRDGVAETGFQQTEHQAEAIGRARDLAIGKRETGWLLLAEGDYAAGPLGARTLGRSVRAGCTEPADEDTFVRIRLAYEGAADRLPDVAWPWYRLAELLAWAGFSERAHDHLAQADRRSLGNRSQDQTARPMLSALVHAGLGDGPNGLPTAARPFPAEPFGPRPLWRLRFR
jgi:hypothetical protein